MESRAEDFFIGQGNHRRWPSERVFPQNNDYERNFDGLSGTITPWEDAGTVIIVPAQPTEDGKVSNPSTGVAGQGGIACGMVVLVMVGVCILGAKRNNHKEQ